MHKDTSENESDRPLAKIAFRDAEGHVETLWAFDLGNHLYTLDNTSWYQYGISYKDIVEALPHTDGLPIFTRVIEKSGYRTLRVMDEKCVPRQLLDKLVEVGCSYEGANPRFIAIDVPPGTDLAAVVRRLIASNAQWEYADPTYEQVYGIA